eukprot:PhF_6_TR40998/c0_g1_i1/m.62098/K01495/GCH1, folE; GTP cyclohydrolase IA
MSVISKDHTDAVRSLISMMTLHDEDRSRDGLHKTPERVVRSLSFQTRGYSMNPHEILQSALFTETPSDHDPALVEVRGIHFNSLCEHHILPFFGKATIRYLPSADPKTGRIVVAGLSKF